MRVTLLLFLAQSVTSFLAPGSDTSQRFRPLGNSFGVPGVNATYDYIIIGGGTAGNAIAARLAEDPRGFRIAVIEAGGFSEFENGNLTEVPGYNGWSTHVDTTRPSLVEWDIETAPQPGYNGKTVHYSQGRTLGGTSAINTLGYHRGTRGFHDLWVKAVDDDAWSWDNSLPNYKRSCHFSPPDFDAIGQDVSLPYDEARDFSSDGGPLPVNYGKYRGEYVNPLADGFKAIGLEELPGLNGGELIGFGAVTLTIDPDTSTRATSATSFLRHAVAKSADGLKIYPLTLAKKILFDDDKRATGVLVAAQGQEDYEFVLSARKEVIVTSGVFRSPQLLMVSGVGPKAVLEGLEIPVISDLPGVGQNLWDQPYYSLSYKVNVTTMTKMSDPIVAAEAAEEYLKSGTGPLSVNNAGELIGWEKIPVPYRSRLSDTALEYLDTFPADFPELELLPFGNGAPGPNHEVGDNYVTFAVGILTPKSRGNVTITSADTRLQPLVSPNFLLDPIDEELAIQGVLRAREWAAATPIVVEEISPGLQVQTEDDIKLWLRQAGALVFHGMSTCAMGKDEDANAVLDSEARVRGVKGLRVADSSSSPLLGPGHPMGTVYMIAEKVATFVLRDSENLEYVLKTEDGHDENGTLEKLSISRILQHQISLSQDLE